MRLKSLSLIQFRNYSTLELSAYPGLNLLLGPNGTGKTNVIEAVAVLTTGFSPRGALPEEMVQWGTDGFRVRGVFESASLDVPAMELEMKYRVGSPRVIRRDGTLALRLKDLVGLVPLVSFVPEDLMLVKGEPDLRRRALNQVLVQVDPAYAESLRRYHDVLKSRNAALKQVAEGRLRADSLEPWDTLLTQEGLVICRKRADFIGVFSKRVGEIHERLSGGHEAIQMAYRPSFGGPWDEDARARWQRDLRGVLPQEIGFGSTLMGPHRDDILFTLNGRAAKAYASEGQKRTCAVSFKLAEMGYLEERLQEKPICLLDDVLSELDAARAKHLLTELTGTGQCFVTMTGFESWPENHPRPATVFQVKVSNVIPACPPPAGEAKNLPFTENGEILHFVQDDGL